MPVPRLAIEICRTSCSAATSSSSALRPVIAWCANSQIVVAADQERRHRSEAHDVQRPRQRPRQEMRTALRAATARNTSAPARSSAPTGSPARCTRRTVDRGSFDFARLYFQSEPRGDAASDRSTISCSTTASKVAVAAAAIRCRLRRARRPWSGRSARSPSIRAAHRRQSPRPARCTVDGLASSAASGRAAVPIAFDVGARGRVCIE